MNPYALALGAHLARIFDAKTVVTLALIGCATWLAAIHILDAAAWVSMCTTVGGLWGLAAAVGTDTGRALITKLGSQP